MVKNRITLFHQIRQPAGRFIKGVTFRYPIGQIMGKIKKFICHRQPHFIFQRCLDMILFNLHVFIKIRFTNNICHTGFNDLKTIPFKIQFNIMVCTRMKIQKIFAHNKYLGTFFCPVIFYIIHHIDCFFKSDRSPAYAMRFKPTHYCIDSLFKGNVRTSSDFFVRTYLSKQFFKNIDHRKSEGNPHRREKIQFKTGMKLMIIHIIICKDRHIFKSGIIQSLSKKGSIVGKAAVTDIFSHTDSHMVCIIFSALQCCQSLSYDHLGRKTYIIIDILLSKMNRLFPSEFKRFCADSLFAECS